MVGVELMPVYVAATEDGCVYLGGGIGAPAGTWSGGEVVPGDMIWSIA